MFTIPNVNFPKVKRENIVEDVTPNREYDGYVNWLGSNIHINPIQYYKNEQRFGELLTHENAHVWQNKFPHLDSEYKNSKKEFLRQAYGNWNDKLRKSFSPLTPVGRNYRFNAELEADNRAVRYRIWDDLKNTIGRVPTLEELDNYINTIDDAVLYKKYIKPSGYLDIYSISEEGDYFKENMQRVRQALIHVAQNNSSQDISHYAALGGHLFYDGGTDGSKEDENVHIFGPGGPTGKKPSGVKKVAHQINIEGQQPAETPPSFEEYVTNHLTELQKSAARSEAQKRYAARYGRKYPFFPNKYQIETLKSMTDQVLQERYKEYLTNFKTKTKAQAAAGWSVVGSLIGAIPHPVTRTMGALMTAPDQAYDWAAAIDEPKPSNTAHVGVDYLPWIAKIIPGKYDDIIFNSLNVVGNVDDAVSTSDNDLFNFLNSSNDNNKAFGGQIKPTYKEWIKKVNPDYISADYDLEAAYNALPYETMEAWRTNPERNHLPDTYKLPNHPTFSNESIYSRGPMIGGSWGYAHPWDTQWSNTEGFTPSIVNKQIHPEIYKEDRPYTEREIYGNRFDEGGDIDFSQMAFDIPMPMLEMAPPPEVVPLDWAFMTSKRTQGYKDMQDIWNYMIKKGVSERNAAAIMGNMMQESSFDPLKVQKGGDKAVGYFQMHGDNLKAYNNWLASKKRTHSNYAQVDFILDLLAGNVEDSYMKEYNRVNDTRNALLAKKNRAKWEQKQLEDYNKAYNQFYARRVKNNTLYPYTQMIEMFNNPDLSLDEITDIFTNSYERAGKPMYEQRRRYAQDIYDRFRTKKKKK